MIAIDPVTYAMALRVLRATSWLPEAGEAADRLQIAAIESAAREIEFNTGLSTLLRMQGT